MNLRLMMIAYVDCNSSSNSLSKNKFLSTSILASPCKYKGLQEDVHSMLGANVDSTDITAFKGSVSRRSKAKEARLEPNDAADVVLAVAILKALQLIAGPFCNVVSAVLSSIHSITPCLFVYLPAWAM